MYSFPRLLILVGAVSWLTLCAAMADSDPSVTAFLTTIYGSYKEPPSGPDLFGTVATIQRVFSPRLAALLVKDLRLKEKRQDEGCFEADPLVDGQDYQLSNFHVQSQSAGAGRAIGIASFLNITTKTIVRFDLVRAGAVWKIDDIHSNAGHGSLRLLLETCLKRQH